MNLSDLFTKENITLALSIFGVIGTTSTWIYSHIKNKKNFDIFVNSYFFNNGLILNIQFINKSMLPLCINDIILLVDEQRYTCQKDSKKIFGLTLKTGEKVTDRIKYYSIKFPINLAPLCGSSGYLHFPLVKDSEINKISIIIYTNRGREVKKTIFLNNSLD